MMYYTGGNVGIGTGSPVARLDIVKPRDGGYLLRAAMTNGAARFYVLDGGDSYIAGWL